MNSNKLKFLIVHVDKSKLPIPELTLKLFRNTETLNLRLLYPEFDSNTFNNICGQFSYERYLHVVYFPVWSSAQTLWTCPLSWGAPPPSWGTDERSLGKK